MSRLKSGMHPLLTEENLEKLNRKNVFTIHQFVEADVKKLTGIIDLTLKNILIIKKHLLNKNAALARRGDEYYKELIKNTAIISTGLDSEKFNHSVWITELFTVIYNAKCSLDNLLGGGFYTGNIYEICGLPASGKTQLCFKFLAKYVEVYNSKIFYLDTKRDISPKRLIQFVSPQKDPRSVLANILVKIINDPYELINSLYEIKDGMLKNAKVRVIIIDSLPSVVYQNDNVAKNFALLNNIANVMRFIANELHVAFIVTNCVTTWKEGNEFVENVRVIEKVGCGRYWFNVPNTRLKVTSGAEDEYEVSVLKSCQLKEGNKCVVKLS